MSRIPLHVLVPVLAGGIGLTVGSLSTSEQKEEAVATPRSTGVSAHSSAVPPTNLRRLPRELSPSLLEWIEEASTDTLYAAWLENELTSHRDLSAVGNLVLRELIARDPDGVCRRLLNEHNSRLLDRALSGWADTDPEGAARLALEAVAQSDEFPDWIVLTPVGRLAKQDPATALTLLEKAPSGSRFRHRVVEALLENLFQSDPSACHDLLESEFLTNRSFPSDTVLASWAEVDINRTIEWIDELRERNPRRHQQGLFSAFLSVSEERPAWAAAQLIERGLLNAGTSPWTLGILLDNWAKSDIEAANTWMQEALPESLRDRVASATASRLMNYDIEFAVAQRLAGSPLLVEHTEWSDLVNALSRKGYHDLLEDLPSRVLPDEREQLEQALRANGHRPTSPEQLMTDLETGLWSTALQQWAHSNPEELIAKIMKFEPEARGDAISGWRDTLANHAPEQLINALRDLNDSSEAVVDTTQFAFSVLALQNATQAKELVLTLPEGNQRDLAIDTIALNLIQQDPEATSDWVASLISQGLRSSDTRAFLIRLQHHSPEHKTMTARRLASP